MRYYFVWRGIFDIIFSNIPAISINVNCSYHLVICLWYFSYSHWQNNTLENLPCLKWLCNNHFLNQPHGRACVCLKANIVQSNTFWNVKKKQCSNLDTCVFSCYLLPICPNYSTYFYKITFIITNVGKSFRLHFFKVLIIALDTVVFFLSVTMSHGNAVVYFHEVGCK